VPFCGNLFKRDRLCCGSCNMAFDLHRVNTRRNVPPGFISFSRAAASETAGYTPSASIFSLPAKV
jgi:hypothetical protein